MAVQLNHHIVHARDARAAADDMASTLGLAAPRHYGPFWVVETDGGTSLDFMDVDYEGDIMPMHYAFLVTEPEFDEIFGRITERGLDFYADPHGSRKGEINHHDGGRGVYWANPDGHWLEIITRPYGSGAQ
jgi:hypothetical protein